MPIVRYTAHKTFGFGAEAHSSEELKFSPSQPTLSYRVGPRSESDYLPLSPLTTVFHQRNRIKALMRFPVRLVVRRLYCSLFLDSQLSTIVAASAAYSVEYMPLAAVGADGQCRSYCLVVSSSLGSSGLRLSSFRMCHFF